MGKYTKRLDNNGGTTESCVYTGLSLEAHPEGFRNAALTCVKSCLSVFDTALVKVLQIRKIRSETNTFPACWGEISCHFTKVAFVSVSPTYPAKQIRQTCYDYGD